MTGTVRHADVLVVGAGPAGLTLARALAGAGVRVLVLDRAAQAGGVPRHSDHPGFGVRDLRRVVSGPRYAQMLAARAERAGAEVLTRATVTDWVDARSVAVTSPGGRLRVDADAVVLATGARERPRAARLVPGDRPAGVFTTGQLQQSVHLAHAPVGTRAVVVGAELVSASAVVTLRQAGCRTVLMTTEHPRPEVPGAGLLGRLPLLPEVAASTRVVRVTGRRRVESVEVEHTVSGRRRPVECDTVVFTGDWIPDHELARLRGLRIDPGTRGPAVDTAFRTDQRGIFAVGNLLHPVDTADVAALDGAAAADQVLRWLGGGTWPTPSDPAVPLVFDGPAAWLAPQLLRPGDPAPARDRLLAWPQRHVARPRVVARQDGRVVGAVRTWWPFTPGRVFRIPGSVLADVRPDGGTVHLRLDTAGSGSG